MSDSRMIELAEESVAVATGNDEGYIENPLAHILGGLIQTNDMVPPWWSEARDRYLEVAWRGNSHLATAVYNAQSKLVAIPPLISPRDPTVQLHVRQAEEMTSRLQLASEFGAGWLVAAERFYEDYLTRDNGAFLEIIGEGDPAGPIMGLPIAVRHLDSSACMRTSDKTYPVIYTDTVGKRYAMHWTRVIFMSQQTSSRVSMNGVGFCAISRALNIAQTLHDIVNHKLEKLGTRPFQRLLIGKGIKASEIMEAFRIASARMDAEGLQRYSRIVAVGSENTDIDLESLDLNQFEPFDEETSVTLGMYTIAAAFGLDISEIWATPRMGAQAEARIANARSRGKLPAQVTSALAANFNLKFLPPYLKLSFDFRDDEEDQQRAIIRDIRGRNRLRDIQSGTLNERAARLIMRDDGDLTRQMFIELELADGRLEDGSPIAGLFFARHQDYANFLSFSVANPLDTLENDPALMVSQINGNRAKALREYNAGSSVNRRQRLREVLAALDWLERQYEQEEEEPEELVGGRVVTENARPRTRIERQDEEDE